MLQQDDAPPQLKVVVLGASGMLGSTLIRQLARRPELDVRGTVRDAKALPAAFLQESDYRLVKGFDVTDKPSRLGLIAGADVVVNAVGVVKQSSGLRDRAGTVAVNALLPHQLAAECAERGSRLVHVSTDCVFSGRDGGYVEADTPDPVDFYGRSKLLGEVEAPALTLRTSIIGHEMQRNASLLDWFLTQPQTTVRGFVNAIYSGVTTHEFARMLGDVVFPRPDLAGVYHVASDPISKFELLELVADQYGWSGKIERSTDLVCDRSMGARRFEGATGYRPPSWPEMISQLYENRPAWATGPDALAPQA